MIHKFPDGTLHNLPDDATPAEIRQLIGEQSPDASLSFMDRVKNKMADVADAVSGISVKNDIALPLANSALKTLPAVGATAGALIGSPFVATGPWGALAPVGGAALGGAAGQSAENYLRNASGIGEQPTEPVMSPLKTGAEMGAWEMGAGSLLKVLGKMAAPKGKAFAENPEGQKLYKYAKDNDLPFSPSTIQPSKGTQFLENAVNLFPSGKAVTTKYQNDLYRWLLNSRTKFVEDMTGIAGAGEGGFIKNAGSNQAAVKDSAKKAYRGITEAAGGSETIIPMENTKQYFDSIYDVAPKKIKELINDFRTRVVSAGEAGGGVGMTAKDFDEFHSVIGKKGSGFKDHISSQVNKDIGIFDAAGEKNVLDALNNAGFRWSESKDYAKISGLFQTATKMGQNGEEIFSPSVFYRVVENPANQEYFKKHLSKNAVENMKEYAELVLKIGEETAKRTTSKNLGFIQAGMLGGGMMANPIAHPTLAIPYGVTPVLAYYMMKPRRVFKQ